MLDALKRSFITELELDLLSQMTTSSVAIHPIFRQEYVEVCLIEKPENSAKAIN